MPLKLPCHMNDLFQSASIYSYSYEDADNCCHSSSRSLHRLFEVSSHPARDLHSRKSPERMAF